MFDEKMMRQLAIDNGEFFRYLHQCEKNLNKRFVDMQTPVLALIMAVASRAPLIFVGPPGTAKSRLIRSFCGLIGMVDLDKPEDDGEDYFEYLLTPFTEPGELFGFYDLAQASGNPPKLVRMADSSLQNAKVIYLDEVFNGSSAILNTMLAIMNEGVFHDRGKRSQVAKQILFGATNDIPDRPELKAFYDRFVLRCFVGNMSEHAKPDDLSTMLAKGFKETYGTHQQLYMSPKDDGTPNDFFDCLITFHKSLRKASASDELFITTQNVWYDKLLALINIVRHHGDAEISNRRLLQIVRIMMIHALYRIATSADPLKAPIFTQQELMLFPEYFLDQRDEEMVATMEAFIHDNRK